jgi:hypothetical protein
VHVAKFVRISKYLNILTVAYCSQVSSADKRLVVIIENEGEARIVFWDGTLGQELGIKFIFSNCAKLP